MNDSAPDLQYYETSLTWNICTTVRGNCLADNAADLPAQEDCNDKYVCGTLDAASALDASPSTSIASSQIWTFSTVTVTTISNPFTTLPLTATLVVSTVFAPSTSSTLTASTSTSSAPSLPAIQSSPGPQATVTVTSTPNPSFRTGPSTGISYGAKLAATLVPVIVVPTLLGALIFWLLRRRRRPGATTKPGPIATTHEKGELEAPFITSRPVELDAASLRQELETPRPELLGDGGIRHEQQELQT